VHKPFVPIKSPPVPTTNATTYQLMYFEVWFRTTKAGDAQTRGGAVRITQVNIHAPSNEIERVLLDLVPYK
jgi:hypothetical protein